MPVGNSPTGQEEHPANVKVADAQPMVQAVRTANANIRMLGNNQSNGVSRMSNEETGLPKKSLDSRMISGSPPRRLTVDGIGVNRATFPILWSTNMLANRQRSLGSEQVQSPMLPRRITPTFRSPMMEKRDLMQQSKVSTSNLETMEQRAEEIDDIVKVSRATLTITKAELQHTLDAIETTRASSSHQRAKLLEFHSAKEENRQKLEILQKEYKEEKAHRLQLSEELSTLQKEFMNLSVAVNAHALEHKIMATTMKNTQKELETILGQGRCKSSGCFSFFW